MTIHPIAEARAKRLDSDRLFLKAQFGEDTESYHAKHIESWEKVNEAQDRLEGKNKLIECLMEER